MFFEKIFEQIKIGRNVSKNRILLPAMHMNHGEYGNVSERAYDFYVTRAKNEVGIVTVGFVSTMYSAGTPMPTELSIASDNHIKSHTRLAKEIKRYGAIASCQLGLYLSQTIDLQTLTEDFIWTIINSFAQSAKRAKEAGYDAVEILGSGGSIVSFFMSGEKNTRKDKWSGTLEKRMTFPLEIIKAIKNETDIDIFFRIHGDEFIPNGYTFEDAPFIAKKLEEAGVSMINVTGGGHTTKVPQLPAIVPRAGFSFLAANVKQSVKIPVSASNRINNPLDAELLLRKGWADLISLGRALLADPQWVVKTKDGDIDDINLCIACNECFDLSLQLSEHVRCTVNPKLGRVSEMLSLKPAQRKRKVLVVGGGTTGLQTAITLKERGHDVILCEKSPFLGGKYQMSFIPSSRGEFFWFLKHLVKQIKKLNVEIRLNTEVTPQVVLEISPDAVVICTGSKPKIPDIRGIDKPNVVMFQDVLSGNADVGKEVVIIGGGGVGIETALYLAKRFSIDGNTFLFLADSKAIPEDKLWKLTRKGHKVTVLEKLNKFALSIGRSTRWTILQEVRELGVELVGGVNCKEITDNGVIAEKDGKELFYKADTVVIAIGQDPDKELYNSLKDRVETYLAGDSIAVGHAMNGTGTGFEVALKI